MTICFFGMYDSKYSRNHTLLKGFRENGVDVVECNVRKHFFYGLRYPKLIYEFFASGSFRADTIFVGFPGQTDVPLAFLLAKIFSKKLFFDAFISVYNTTVFDRKYFKENSFRARFYWFLDWLSCYLSDKVILDTNAHIDYFAKTFHLPKNKFIRVFVGTDTDIFKPKKLTKIKKGKFVVGFHGSYLPLQGVPIILSAAKLLNGNKNILFRLLGKGLEYDQCLDLAKELKLSNVKFLDKVPYEKLPDFINKCDLYLGGPFSDNIKAGLVIPNKVYEAMACGKPVIVGESEATKELLTSGVNCFMVERGDSKVLAKSILKIRGDWKRTEEIAKEGYSLAHCRLSPYQVTADLAEVFYGEK